MNLANGPAIGAVAHFNSAGRTAHDDLVCPPPVLTCDHPARGLALCSLHAQLSRRRCQSNGASSTRSATCPLIVIIYLVGVGVVLSPTIQAKWNGASASNLAASIGEALPNALAWPAGVYHSMTGHG